MSADKERYWQAMAMLESAEEIHSPADCQKALEEMARAITAANHYAADSVTRLGTQTSYIDREAFTRIYPEFAQIGE